ncbi:MAG: hypothetical protein JSV54_06295 [Chloroflexota bacterium]|nr:MAG: hypothetical protein JSV54_06295 [Chloroflexota bacterium]
MQQMVKCPSCGRESAGPQFCTTCGGRLPIASQQDVWETETVPVAKPTSRETAPTTKYGALRAVATVYRIIGWVLMVGGTIFSIALAVIAVQGTGAFSDFIPWGTVPSMVGIAIVGLVVSMLLGLFLLAFSELCSVLIDIEFNTRSQD